MIFSDEETFAGTLLILEAMRSPNFLAGVSGWSINKDGSAEFNNITIRGSTTTQGLTLMYNGTPAAGNLILSISPTAGVDTYGNAYVAGEGLYGANGKLTAKDAVGNTAVVTGNIPGGGPLGANPGMAMQPIRNTGDPATIGALDPGGPLPVDMALLLTSPSPVVGGLPGTDFAQIYMNSPNGGGSKSGVTVDAGNVSLNGTNFDANGAISGYAALNTYIPTMTGAGTATFSSRTGWWQRVGKMIFFNGDFITSSVGTGAANLTITTPTAVDRSVQQTITGHVSGTATANGTVCAIALTGGTSTTLDRIRSSTGVNLTGADLANGATAGAIVNIQGWYREA